MSRPLEEHLDALVGKLDLSRKVRLLTGASHAHTYAEPAVGLRAMTFSDGPAGVRGPSWDDEEPSACLPCPTAVAASWDTGRAADAGRLLAAEARRKEVDVVLAPTINLHRSPVGGRHFECLSEDPLLTGRIGAALVGALQEHGVAATVKHYVANDSETDRFSVDVRLGERALRELYLAPFEDIVLTARPWLLMAAYNGVNGTTMTEHELLDDPLRTRWGFDGVVVSDWRATRSLAAASAGLDLAMPGPDGPWGEVLRKAVEDGAVPESTLDIKVKNLLRLAARVGALESVHAGRPAAVRAGRDVRARLRAAAADGTVLLHNARAALPLPLDRVRRIAVIGELAEHPRIQGGGSAEVCPAQVVSPLQGLRAALPPGVEVTYTAGSYLDGDPGPLPAACLRGENGGRAVRVRWLTDTGEEVRTESRDTGELVRFGSDVPQGAAAVELTTTMCPDLTGSWQLGFRGAGRIMFEADGRTLHDEDVPSAHDGPGADILTPPVRTFDVELTAGRPVELRVRQRIPAGGFALSFRAMRPRRSPADELARARQDARAADVAIVVVGTSSQIESEGFDRAHLCLPAGQDDLVRAVAEENPNTVAVVNAGAPVLLPWRGDVSAVLIAWFAGQEAGAALADILTGTAEPGGRLPMTWPAHTEDVPVLDTRPVDGRLPYREGIHVGYRAWLREGVEPAYPFGHGLGYTTWELVDLRQPAAVRHADAPDSPATVVTARVRNTGGRPGKQVVQVYLARPGSGIDRPVRWLAGFATAHAGPGETVELDIPVPWRALWHWDSQADEWAVEPGTFDALVGFSSADLHKTTTVDVPAGTQATPGGTPISQQAGSPRER
ncbi:beta-glucosidase [Streptomyces sp. TRM68367]|uniref:beta-glucosidase family protein n=1 Tax=Streptomyces sp. TRM68367 TaxID=2758415 RepID=UPI00165C97AD|nr:glycoside hydrolase family 3 C-terminal domain-containing protein [Streptomyces sp. TRM68367]MBC9727270.1 glycoside hydrolase family 3 C-terminal domain-containing protein [Streptomyces sp. TRM68367]